MIETINLKKSFDGQRVLKGINLTIADGELVVIMGKSGGGKSVLLKHIIGLIKPDSGSILIDGVDVTKLTGGAVDEMREKFGVLFQGGALFDSLTAYQNVAFPLREKTKLDKGEIREKVLRSLEDVGLRGIGKKYPAELSGGMKKRVALARALITEPKVVFFDEPTTGLDPIILNSIHRLIRSTHKKYGFTGVMISHEIPEIFDVADRVAMLHDGVIVEVGTPGEIKRSSNPVVKQFITGSLEGPIESVG
ncbi:MAG TPA: ABC transporter ATP-binding protein [Thermodesulfovibrionales bacterium]|nr:ABC transporter ATP-binding protein [Thermodesulfovibrionales bacterium]